MKKIITLVLSLCLLITSVSAFAESTPIANGSKEYNIVIELPEGFEITENEYLEDADLSAVIIDYPAAETANFYLMIAYDELFGTSSLSDMDAETEQAFFEYATAGFEAPTYEMRSLDNDVRVMVLNEDGASDFAYVMTVYHGYFVFIYIAHEDYSTIGNDDIEKAVALVDAIAFEKAE